jgi:Ca2+-binding RTX toxin-like protein
MYGGFGADTMTGGFGADTFVIEGANQTSAWVPFMTIYDNVTDFSSAQGDRIDVSAIDANLWMAGNQAFSYINGNAFSGVAGQLRFAGGFVQGDLNGDTWADFQFQVNAASLAANDFVL